MDDGGPPGGSSAVLGGRRCRRSLSPLQRRRPNRHDRPRPSRNDPPPRELIRSRRATRRDSDAPDLDTLTSVSRSSRSERRKIKPIRTRLSAPRRASAGSAPRPTPSQWRSAQYPARPVHRRASSLRRAGPRPAVPAARAHLAARQSRRTAGSQRPRLIGRWAAKVHPEHGFLEREVAGRHGAVLVEAGTRRYAELLSQPRLQGEQPPNLCGRLRARRPIPVRNGGR
jgi:hypothetical protein